ncbi:DUF4876 domain-containing protein [Myroides odoratimimus]|uniref:DUF4876 domain-containing protein n=1 Tax=Myroides odoratimimus TaxID=76832 RepID=UPI0025777898|nr:DUF4876 domain-containing protein [Myroides odoratimimus]MDM1499531.1 DUF4876 domain-containing protein [Myroides odoratimimus]
MKAFSKASALFLTMVLLFTACSSDDSNIPNQTKDFTITIRANDGSKTIEDFSNFTYELYNQNSSKKLTGKLNTKGEVELSLEVGNYDIKLEDHEIGFGLKSNVSINKDQIIIVDIELIKQTLDGLVISELFTAGEGAEDEYGEYVELGDQYVVIYNNSNQTKYLDGVSFAITEHWNKFPYNNTTQEVMANNEILAALIYTFPGSGKEYPIAPGEEKVFARSAKDFSEGGKNKNAADLSGVDFEAVLGSNDTDNPKVANVIINGTTHADMLGYGVGYAPAFLFKQEGDLKEFLTQNMINIESMYGPKSAFKIPVDIIIDGVETGQVGQMKYKSLLNQVDRGYIAVSDTGTREVYTRKVKQEKEGRKVYADTNNSTEDFQIRVGQRNFPAK